MRINGLLALTATLFALAACSGPPWKEYAFPDKGFAASFPSQPVMKDLPGSPDGVRAPVSYAEITNAQGDFTVGVTDSSKSTKSSDEILSELPVALAQGGTVKLMTYMGVMAPSGALVGRDFQIDMPGRPTMHARIFVQGKRVYQVVAFSAKGPTDPVVIRFLDSFKLTTG